MKNIINKYKDENGYVKDFNSLYRELVDNQISEDIILSILKKLKEENNKIKNKIEIEYKNKKKIIDNKEKIENVEFIRKEKNKSISNTKTIAERMDIRFYIDYIENNKNSNYLEILPITNNSESIKIIDTILAYYLKEINTIKYLLTTETNEIIKENYINELIIYTDIFKSIKKYKESILYKEHEKIDDNKNELIFYMNGNISYIYSDIEDSPECFFSIKLLLNSIENGTFKNIKPFTNNDKIKGLYEVRDLANNTRIIFENLGGKKYCIIYAITDKKETNLLYKQRLYIRCKRYQEEKENIKSLNEVKEMKLILRGE